MMDNKDVTIYEKNTETIKCVNPYLWEIIKDEYTPVPEVYVDVSAKEEAILAFVDKEQVWYLNSRYDAEYAAQVWAKSLGERNFASIIVVFGFGNGMYIKELRKQYPQNMIVVYEPSRDIFEACLHEIDLSELFDEDNLYIAVGEDGHRLFMEYILTFINYSNFTHVVWKCVPNYQRLFQLEYLKVQNVYMNWVRQITLDRNTWIMMEDEFVENTFRNMWDCLNGYSIDDLMKKIQSTVDVETYPAIIVSAGPSLDKNIEQLKMAKNKAFLIVVDTALKAVLRAGIMPDLTITIDPHKPLVLFEDERIATLPMVVCIMSNTKVLDSHKGKKIYFGDTDSYCQKLCESVGKKLHHLESGGSVANNAFSLARYIGFKNLILIGQDLAYPDKKGHTKDAYDDEEKNTIDFSKKKYIEVEDIHGQMVWTEGNMDAYRRWFESQIVRYPQYHVIDATEGGAKIRGTEIMTLQEAIERTCANLPEVDYKSAIASLTPFLTSEEVAKIKEELLQIPNELRVIEEKLHGGIEKYKKLKRCVQSKKASKNQLKTLMADISELTDWLEGKREMALVHIHNHKADYDMKNKVYDIKNDFKDEVTTIADNGIEMYESYLVAIKELEKNLTILYQRVESSDKV